MFKQTALITWQPDATETNRAALLSRAQASISGADLARFASTVPGSNGGGDIVWHLHFVDQPSWAVSGAQAALDLIASDPAVANLDAVAYEVQRFTVSRPDVANGIYRTLFTSVDPAAPLAEVHEFTGELADMQGYIPEILNWAINPTIFSRGRRIWTHVWEQEFADISDLKGPYMTSPYHWAVVDRWFDPEMPCKIVDTLLCHSASVLETSVMVDYTKG